MDQVRLCWKVLEISFRTRFKFLLIFFLMMEVKSEEKEKDVKQEMFFKSRTEVLNVVIFFAQPSLGFRVTNN